MDKIYKSIYFHFIRTSTRNNSNPAFDAFLLISVLGCMNILSFWGIINYYLEIKVSKNIGIISGISLYIFMTVVNFLLLYRNRKKIIDNYAQFDLKDLKKGKLYSMIYLLTSIAIFICVLFNLVNLNY